ncbi:NADPH-dependent FMN reductase [Methanoregula sp.]|uniref:NADPH-dependent FMN reductase n=1 Tax=Methanoregula sp. TaxID=2052170 RepID=UPI002629D875|nr:NADPH-dependent FMN reductase [Methanoregula sp.]MDD5144063.1 NAD(P)H-dependent oxidoreductase [Methanoregula sp.]
MSRYSITVIVGSLRKESLNRQLAEGLVQLAPQDFSFTRVPIGDLPLYNQDDDDHPAPAVTRMKDAVRAADGLLIVTPEYNRSIPGVLKNALDHGSRPPGQSVWAGKPAGIIGISPGAMGTAMAQQHLRNILSFLDVSVMRQPEAYLQMREGMFNADGTIGEGSLPRLRDWMEHYCTWIRENVQRDSNRANE